MDSSRLLGTDYERKKQKLMQELQLDYKHNVSKVWWWKKSEYIIYNFNLLYKIRCSLFVFLPKQWEFIVTEAKILNLTYNNTS